MKSLSHYFVRLLGFLPFGRAVGELPPEPLPRPASISRDGLPPVVNELASICGRFVVLISLEHEKTYRGHSCIWLTNADDDVWSAFWSRHDLGIFTDDCSIITEEAQHRIETYEREHPFA